MARSMTSTFSPVESLIPRAYHSLVMAPVFILQRDSIIPKKITQSPLPSLLIGNGVVIHLPGLFEEGDKNDKKGISYCCKKKNKSVNWSHAVLAGIWFLFCVYRSERLGEETHCLWQSSHWYVQMFIRVCITFMNRIWKPCDIISLFAVSPQCLISTRLLMAYRKLKDKHRKERSKGREGGEGRNQKIQQNTAIWFV